ncbi:hypothetical protein M758_7G126500 [Ceratodon purpureus]|uniref:Uncharacterized protein n=1 Tax=Ceratodon purpureus TaxID=3225 RepID=A0A8T0H6S0_CERPU|nr:hypothetical protein KC19_7G150700 [Ceratodon purpureus]KAG0611251.1 hypothetical protein M758_7G126500 [Ceratodon purpureus]
MSTCQRVPDDTYHVVITHPKSLRTRCGETWLSCVSRCACFCGCFLVLSFAFLTMGLCWVLIYCSGAPDIALEAISINDMQLYQNNTIPASESPWHVNSGFNVRLSAWNPNTVTGCFSTFRRIMVRVEYRGQLILQQEVPLGFGLKPRRSRPVPLELKGSGFQLKNPDLGPFMESELRSANLSFDFYFDARYLRNDRKAGWVNMGCHVVTQSPSNSSQAGANNLLYQDCMGY